MVPVEDGVDVRQENVAEDGAEFGRKTGGASGGDTQVAGGAGVELATEGERVSAEGVRLATDGNGDVG